MARKTVNKIQCEDCGDWIKPNDWQKHWHAVDVLTAINVIVSPVAKEFSL